MRKQMSLYCSTRDFCVELSQEIIIQKVAIKLEIFRKNELILAFQTFCGTRVSVQFLDELKILEAFERVKLLQLHMHTSSKVK